MRFRGNYQESSHSAPHSTVGTMLSPNVASLMPRAAPAFATSALSRSTLRMNSRDDLADRINKAVSASPILLPMLARFLNPERASASA